MKKVAIAVIAVCYCLFTVAIQAQDNKTMIERACLDYLEGFYKGDTTKLINCLKPSLHKLGYRQDEKTGNYAPDRHMT